MQKKECTSCLKEKSLSSFYKNKKCAFGVSPECKKCKSLKDQEYNKNRRVNKSITSLAEATRPLSKFELDLINGFIQSSKVQNKEQ